MTGKAMTVPAARGDLDYLSAQLGDQREGCDLDVAMRAGTALSKAIGEVLALEASRIGAGDYLAQFDGGDFDAVSFYRGVSFALARVDRILRGDA